ncbi:MULTISPECIES: acyl carrier protein [Streptomyces]|uniref:Acyl carrier protein n=1 Tax=Streptomyces nondiastaticus TaxID=3154512 RepID=A0ABW6U2T8_9ACTN|nr:acyl carrier protein [Streptomyces sp. VNUA116]WKU43056.1 acyl carrier protein [Streptomyces sp. VNUA116]
MDALRRRRPQVHGRLVRHARRPGGHARVRDEIKRLLASRLRLSAGALDEQATLESLGLDSLPLAETMVALQDQYDVHPDLVLLGDRLTPTRPLAALVDELTRSVRTP